MTNAILTEPVTPFAYKDDFVLSSYHETGLNTSLGFYGEQYAHKLLIDSGFLVRYTAKLAFSGDLRVICPKTGESRAIEVKTAYENYKGRYKFCLRKIKHTDISYSDFVMLIAIDKHCSHYIYLIPASLLFSQSLTIASNPLKYAGKYAPFRVRGLIDFDHTETVARLW